MTTINSLVPAEYNMNMCSEQVNISYKKYDKYFRFTISSYFFTRSMANVKIALSQLLGQAEGKTEN